MREQVLMLVYLGITKLTWADETDPKILRACLDSTYDEWIKIFESILSSETTKSIGIKMQVFRVAIL